MTEQTPATLSRLHPAWLIATVCGIGKSPIAPGTFGSLAAFPLAWLLFWLFGYYSEAVLALSLPYVPLMIAFWLGSQVILFLKGVWASNVYMRHTGTHDPGEIVIDEVSGQLLVFTYAYGHIFRAQMVDTTHVLMLCVVSFILFRLFDILKPWPICWLDRNVKGGLGVMLDDIGAGVAAIITLHLLVPILPL